MSNQKPPKKKKVVVTSDSKKKAAPSTTRRSKPVEQTLSFGKQNYMWMGIGAACILLGLLLMTGGAMPSPDVWDDNIIYSTRRTALAPIVILIGLCIEIYAIFKKA